MSSNTSAPIPEFESVDVASNTYPKPPVGQNTTDVIYQPVRLYIEGVEIPFVSISINQAIGSLPSCEFEVPPHAGLMDIVRYYQPKVHIFFEDRDRGGDRLLFWGHISAASYSRSRSGGYASIHFRCNHRNQLANDILLYYGNVLNNEKTKTSNTPAGTNAAGNFSSITAIASALAGITGVAEDTTDLLSPANPNVDKADVSKLDATFKNFEQRLIGMPGAIINLWQQLKKSFCQNPKSSFNILTMYMPLFEQGLSYFKRMSGHYLLEKQQQDSRLPYCPDTKDAKLIMAPPSYRNGTMDAVQTNMAVQAIQSSLGMSGEMTSFVGLCEQFCTAMEYEIITLASPAEVNIDPVASLSDSTTDLCAVETILKPQTPFYYSPICNVIFPRMFETIDVTQDEDSVPTRIVAYHSALQDQQGVKSNYRGPNTVREVMSLGAMIGGAGNAKSYNLRDTTGNDYNIPSKYEQGRGIHPVKINLPPWLALLFKNQDQSSSKDSARPDMGSKDYKDFLLQSKAWEDRYGYDLYNSKGEPIPPKRNTAKDGLNPYGVIADINPHERIMFGAVDYEFTKAVARSRSGTITGVFNPYIIPGYPMDVIDDDPNNPSFHGLCSSVTHTITSRSISTVVCMVAAVTYAELTNYYHPPLHPWLQTALGMLNEDPSTQTSGSNEDSGSYGSTSALKKISSTILQNPEARLKANQFYYSVLGVGAADPTEMIDFVTNQAIPQMRKGADLAGCEGGGESVPTPNGGESNDWLTTVGNLRLVSRNIEGKDSIATKFKYLFIDMSTENYGGSTIQYSNPALDSDTLLEPGASMFLDYMEPDVFIQRARDSIPK